MPKFEPVAWRYELKAGEYTFAEKRYFDEAYVQRVIALHTADQLAEAYEAGKREHAAQIEMMREALGYRIDHPKVIEALSTTPDQALEQFAAKVREQCAHEGWIAASGDCEDRVRAAIRNIKGLPK